MAKVCDSQLNPIVQESPLTVAEPLVTHKQSDPIIKKSNCSLIQEEKNSVNGSVLEKCHKGVCEISEMAKKKEDLVDFCGDDCEGSVKCALKIEVIDDTALIGPANPTEIFQMSGDNNKRNVTQESHLKGVTVVGSADHFQRNGNNKRNVVQGSDGNGKRISGFDGNLERNVNDKRNLMQESDESEKRIVGSEESLEKNGNVYVVQESELKKERRSRRRGKKNDGNKKSDEKENVLTSTPVGTDYVQALTVSREGKIGYSRKEMEALRFVDMEEQKNKWVAVYCGIGPEIAKEYDSLVDSDNQKQKNLQLDFDPRRQYGNRISPSMFGPFAAKGSPNHPRVFVH